jgi:hypothetical protein
VHVLGENIVQLRGRRVDEVDPFRHDTTLRPWADV